MVWLALLLVLVPVWLVRLLLELVVPVSVTRLLLELVPEGRGPGAACDDGAVGRVNPGGRTVGRRSSESSRARCTGSVVIGRALSDA